MEKIKVDLNGTAQTMLQSFYARTKYSKSPKCKFYDAKAVELVDRIDYDFSSADKDAAMGSGVIARTIIFDELVTDFIKKILNVRSSMSHAGWIPDKPFARIPYINKVTEKILIFECG